MADRAKKRKSKVLSDDMAAYKMYLIESISTHQPQDWKRHTNSANYRGLDSQKEALKNFITESLKAFDGPKADSKDRTTLTVATLIDNLKDQLDQVLSQEKADTIAQVFSVPKNFAKFIEDETIVKGYFEKYKEKLREKNNDPNSKIEHSFVYVLYYWKKSDIDYAILETRGYSNIWTGGTLTYYHKSPNPKPTDPPYYAGSSQTFKKCVVSSGILFIDCKGKSTEPDDKNSNQKNGNEIHTFLTIQVGTRLVKDWQILLATYSTVRRSQQIPACGLALLQMATNKDEAVNVINAQQVDDRIYNFLYERRLNTILESTLISLDDLPSDVTTKKLSQYAGIYVGRHLDSKYDDNSPSGAFRTVLMQIFKNGKAVIRYLIGRELRELNGFFHPHGKILLYGTFKNDLQTNDSDKLISRIHFVLEVPLKKDGKYLNGVYSGFRENVDLPKAGLISFKLVPEASNFDDKSIDGRLFPKNFKKNDQLAISEIRAQLLKPNFIGFFRGDFGDYFDSLRKSMDPQIYERQNVIHSQVSSKYQGPIGVFFMYSFSSAKRSIVRYPLMLDQNGIATLKYTTEDNITETSVGRGLFNEQYLILDFKLDGKHENKGMYLFYVNKGNFSQLKIAAGISLRINFKRKPQAKREFLIPHFLPKLSGEKHFDAIDWATLGPEMIKQFNAIDFKDIYVSSEEFVSLTEVIITTDGQRGSVVETLLGREYNIITTSTATNEAKLLDREDFWRIYLIAAWWKFQDEITVIERIRTRYLHQKAQYYRKLFKETKSYPYFYLSMEHGLVNLEKEILMQELGMLMNKAPQMARMEELFLEWYKDISSEFLIA